MGVEPSVSGPLSIISGAQAGVDRGALDAALDAGIPRGGWVPSGREAEDGRIPDWYLFVEPCQEVPCIGTSSGLRPLSGWRRRDRRGLRDHPGIGRCRTSRSAPAGSLTEPLCAALGRTDLTRLLQE
ncbi:YpsA SLOG family protein [Spectribacter acetivorans]|uniref:YpsA SLOG family protein n=1 Tax=Spectribacter acetivorans TaxID=3075603 RepID=UPI003D7777B8